MFLGHFALGLAAKKAQPKVSLAALLLAAQFLDLLWPVFLVLGIEHVELATTGPVPLIFSDYPISHGLFFVLAWALIFAVVYFLIKKRLRAAVILGALVVSHWFLDLLVHNPDLPVLPGNELRLGLGLWNYRWAVLGLELVMLTAGIIIYRNTTIASGTRVSFWFWLMIGLLILIQLGDVAGPPPDDVTAIGWLGNLQWLFILLAWLAERKQSLQPAAHASAS